MPISQQKTISTFQQSQPQPDISPKRALFISLTIDITYTLFKIVFIAALFYLLLAINLNDFKSSNSYNRMQQNLSLWQKQIIVDFYVTNAYNCPQNYEDYTNSSWPGNIQGCLCSININLYAYQIVLQGQCSQAQFAKGCLNVASHQSIPYTFWHSGVHLCVKRLQNYNFYTLFSDIIYANTSSQYSCSNGSDYQIDLLSEINCPITTIVNNSSLQQTVEQFNYSFAREDNFPIVQFRISQYAFCQNFKEQNISPGREFNYILQTIEKHQCKSLDNRTIIMDSIPQTTLLLNNPSINNVVSQLPDYPPPDSIYLYKLGYIRYPAWSYSCRTSQDFDLVTATTYLDLQEITDFYSSTSISILVILALQLIYLVYYWISNYLYHKSKYILGYLYLKDYQIKKFNRGTNIGRDKQSEFIKFIFVQVFSGIILIVFVVIYQKSSSTQTWFKNSQTCTDKLMINYLKSYQLFFGMSLTYAMACIFITIGVILLDLVYYVWRRWRGDLEQEPQIQVQQIQQGVSDTISEQKQINNGKSSLIQVTQQCLIANSFLQTQKDNKFYQNKLLFQLQEIEKPVNSPIQISDSFYSEQDSDHSD